MHAYVFLHASMLYLNVCLSIFRLCHALCAPWVCACRSLRPLTCVVASVPLVVCLDVTTREIHLCDVGVLDTHFSSLHACLACFVPPAWLSLLLCIFACLRTCSCTSLCVVHTPISWSYGHPIKTYIFPLFV